MDKLKMHSPDLSQENIAKIRELFPGCVTEAHDKARGQLRLAVDFDQLRQELSDHIVEGPQERYRLDYWPGKREALRLANMPINKALRPCHDESVNFQQTKNLFIEGDNLDALKLIQESYLGKAKLIYIDPPYNTGGDFIYHDDFTESFRDFRSRSNQVDDNGNRLIANPEAKGRFHSDWLSMFYGHLEKRRYEGSRRKSWYRDRRVKRAWNSRGPHDASRCLLRHLHPFDTIPPRHRRAPSLSQRPGRLSSNDNPTIATTPSDHYTCTNPYLC